MNHLPSNFDSSTNPSSLRDKLQIIQQNAFGIRAFVIQEVLEQDDIATFLQDVIEHGCQSGVVSSLIYYNDTYRFYDRYYDEIEALREDYEENTGTPITIKGDLKNFFAWFAFEEYAYQLGEELGIF